MPIKTRFFSGVYYGQDDFKKMIKDGLTSGYVKGVGDGLKVTADGKSMVIQVGIGRGYLVGYSFDVMDDPYDLTVKGNTETEVRYDRVIAHMDEESGITLVIKQGDSKNPPELVREGKIYEISLAKIKVNRNVGVITQDNITDERGNKSVCGIVGPHYEALPVATKDTIGAVSVDTSTGLKISNAGVLGYDGIARTIYIDVGDDTAPSTQTVVGTISGGGTRVSDSSVHNVDWEHLAKYSVSVSIAPSPTAKLYSGLVANKIRERPRVVSCKAVSNSGGGYLIIGRKEDGREIVAKEIITGKPDTIKISLPADWDYNTDKLYVQMWGYETYSKLTVQMLPDAPADRLAYWQYPEGTEVPVVPPLLSQTDIDQDDLIAKIIEKIGGL